MERDFHFKLPGFPGGLFLPLLLCCLGVMRELPLRAQLYPENLTQYTEREGLPSNAVMCAYSDRRGCLWVGTMNGLALFDGYTFQRYRMDQDGKDFMGGLIVSAIAESRNGELLLGGGELVRYNPITLKTRHIPYFHLVKNPLKSDLLVRSIVEREDGKIYLGISTGTTLAVSNTLLCVEPGDSMARPVAAAEGLNLQNIFSLEQDPDGNLWIVGYSGVLKMDPTGRITRAEPIEEEFRKAKDPPTDLKIDRSGHLWFVTARSVLYDFDPRLQSWKRYDREVVSFENRWFARIAFDRQEKLWISGWSTLLCFDPSTSEFSRLEQRGNTGEQLSNPWSIHADSFGALWAGTLYNGLFRYEARAVFRALSFQDTNQGALSSGWVGSFYECQNGKILILSSGVGFGASLRLFEPETGRIEPFLPQGSEKRLDYVSSVLEMGEGNFWLGLADGIYTFSPSTGHAAKC